MTVATALWGSPTRKTVTSIAGMVAAVAGAVVAVPPAWEAMGLPEVASRNYVHETVRPIQLVQDKTSATLDRLYKSQLELYRSQLQDQLFRAQQDPAQNSPTVQQRVQDLHGQIEEVTKKIDAAPSH